MLLRASLRACARAALRAPLPWSTVATPSNESFDNERHGMPLRSTGRLVSAAPMSARPCDSLCSSMKFGTNVGEMYL